jgi:hypothetical protein
MITNTLRGVGELQAGGVALHQQRTAMVHATHDNQYPARRGWLHAVCCGPLLCKNSNSIRCSAASCVAVVPHN